MKTTERFKQVIKAYLDNRAEKDELFDKSYQKEGKTIDGCCNFILNTAKESGCAGFDDSEVFGMAVHYYDEDNLDPKYLKEIPGEIVVNHAPTLTAEEMAELTEKAKRDFYEEQMRKQRETIKPKPAKKEVVQQASLF